MSSVASSNLEIGEKDATKVRGSNLKKCLLDIIVIKTDQAF